MSFSMHGRLLILGLSAVCSFSEGPYKLDWVLGKNDLVHFQLTYNGYPANVNGWTGVAFGQSMFGGLDAVVVKVLNGRVTVTDEYVQGYGPSWPDRSQDVQTQKSSLANGVLRVRFVRPLKATEPGVDHSLEGCTPWQFVVGPGMASADHVGKHSRTPTGKQICMEQCRV
ncbi:DOMON domain containing protein [Aphelenchoides avenae]|nr:DOMON domain containing protein [Aphelenchus avenae]